MLLLLASSPAADARASGGRAACGGGWADGQAGAPAMPPTPAFVRQKTALGSALTCALLLGLRAAAKLPRDAREQQEHAISDFGSSDERSKRL